MDKTEPKRDAVCVICFKPDPIWFEFLSSFEYYDKYVAIDDNSENYADYKLKYPSVNIIQIENDKCEKNGFININYELYKKSVTGWEKSLFYFFEENKAYEQVWFFEDDVFFYNEHALKNIDAKFPDSDLLTAPCQVSTGASKDWWWWPRVTLAYEPPYYNAMVCAARVSKQLLFKLNEYASENNTLFFLEALFPTVAIKNNLKYDTPKQMAQIFFRHQWCVYMLSKKNIFHPLKNRNYHKTAREKLSRNNPLIPVTFHVVDLFTKLGIGIKMWIKSVIGK
jgi:hypothetical protein